MRSHTGEVEFVSLITGRFRCLESACAPDPVALEPLAGCRIAEGHAA